MFRAGDEEGGVWLRVVLGYIYKRAASIRPIKLIGRLFPALEQFRCTKSAPHTGQSSQLVFEANDRNAQFLATGPRNGLIQRVCGLRSSRWVYHTFLNPRHIILSRPHYHSLYGLPSDDLAEDELCTSTTPLAPLASLGSSPIVIFQSRFPVIGSSGINRM